MTCLLGWNVPTILTVCSFSLFAYFIAKLNVLIESSQKKSRQERRLSLSSERQRERMSSVSNRRLKVSL